MADTNHSYTIYGSGDMKVSLVDEEDGTYRLTVGSAQTVDFFGTLEELAQVFAMGEALVEHERTRKAMPPGCEEEKKRAEGE